MYVCMYVCMYIRSLSGKKRLIELYYMQAKDISQAFYSMAEHVQMIVGRFHDVEKKS